MPTVRTDRRGGVDIGTALLAQVTRPVHTTQYETNTHMVFTGSSIQEEVAVQVSGDSAELTQALDGAEQAMFSFKGAVGAVGVALGALATGALAKSVDAARAFEQQMVELEKVTNPEIAEEMGTAIQEMAEEIPLAQRELAGIAEQAGRLGIRGVENIREFTRVTSEMAVATDLTADEAANAFARITQLTGVPIENVRALGSAINELSNTMATTSSEITDAVLRAGAAMRQLGLSAEETVALSAALNEVSESSERAGTRLRRLAQEVQTVSESDLEAMAESLGLTAEEFRRMREESPVELLRMMASTMAESDAQAQALAGTLSTTSQQALAALGTNLDGLNGALETSGEQFAESTSLTEEFEAANATFNAELQRTQNRLRNIAITTGEVLLPALSDALGGLNRLLDSLSRFNSQTNGVAGAVGLLATAIGGLVGGGALLASQLGLASTAAGGLGAVLTALTGPIGVVIAAVAGLAAAYATNFGGIRDSVDAAIGRVIEILGRLEPIIERLQPAVERLGAVWDRVAPHIETVVGVAVDGILGLLTTLVDSLVTTIEIIAALAQGDWAAAWDALAGLFERTLNGMLDFVDRWAGDLAAAMLTAVADAIDAAGQGFTGFLNDLPGVSIEGQLGGSAVTDLRQQAATFREDSATVDVNVQVDSRDEKFEVFVDDRVRRNQQQRTDRVRRSTGGLNGQ